MMKHHPTEMVFNPFTYTWRGNFIIKQPVTCLNQKLPVLLHRALLDAVCLLYYRCNCSLLKLLFCFNNN